MESEIVALRGQIGLLSARLSAAEQAILEIRGQKSPAEAYVSPEFERLALEQIRSRRLSVNDFREMISAMAKDFAELDLNGVPADMAGVGKIAHEGSDRIEMVTLPPINCDHADMKDGGQRIQPRFKFRNMITKLLNFRPF